MVAEVLVGKRVAILVQNLPVPFDRRVWQEALALRDAGASVSVICPANDTYPVGEFVIDGIEVLRFQMPPEAHQSFGYLREYGVSLYRMWRLLRKLGKNGPFDVIHYCNPPDLLAFVALGSRTSKQTKLVFDQHDLGPELVKAKRLRFGEFLVRVAAAFEGIAYRAADHVIATNESYRTVAIRRGRKAKRDVTVVRSGPYRNWGSIAERSEQWHNGRAKLVGYVGVMGQQEGIDYLLDAAHYLVHEKQIDVQFCLVGSGTDIMRLKERAGALGLEEHVSFPGRLPDKDLISVLSNADVCVNPDEVNDLNDKSTMNKIIEYMALGKPVVQFDVTEGRHSAQNAALYASANDARSFAVELEKLLRDSRLATSMGAAGRKRFESELCWETQAPKLIEAYSSTLSLK